MDCQHGDGIGVRVTGIQQFQGIDRVTSSVLSCGQQGGYVLSADLVAVLDPIVLSRQRLN